jgi:hypothetical protein
MNHESMKQNVLLLAYGELEQEQRKQTEEHIQNCAACRHEYAEIAKLHRLIGPQTPLEPSEQLLYQARQSLRSALRQEREKPSWIRNLREQFSGWLPQPRFAMGYSAALLIGLLVGYLVFANHTPGSTSVALAPTSADMQEMFNKGNVEITNVRFLDANAKDDGQVEFAFDAVRPMTVKGSLNDTRIQKVLTYAMVKEQNPGVRLRAINALQESKAKPDPEMKHALITAMKNDENAGVRREALSLLQKFNFDEELRNAYLYVLQHDKNAAMRIAAIKSLEARKADDKEVINVLKDRMQSDTNNYIRMKAKAVLQEVSEQ